MSWHRSTGLTSGKSWTWAHLGFEPCTSRTLEQQATRCAIWWRKNHIPIPTTHKIYLSMYFPRNPTQIPHWVALAPEWYPEKVEPLSILQQYQLMIRIIHEIYNCHPFFNNLWSVSRAVLDLLNKKSLFSICADGTSCMSYKHPLKKKQLESCRNSSCRHHVCCSTSQVFYSWIQICNLFVAHFYGTLHNIIAAFIQEVQLHTYSLLHFNSKQKTALQAFLLLVFWI